MTGEANGSAQDTYVPECIMITGGAGFIGSHVVLRLVKRYPQYKVFNTHVSAQSCTSYTLLSLPTETCGTVETRYFEGRTCI
eukprot:scaffold658495_cov70-Prasinocladus_malaysianus.AAC.1